MNIRQIIKRLSSKNGLFVSFYLPISPGETRKEFVTTFHSHLKDLKHAARNLRHKEEKFLDTIIEKIEDYLETADTHNTKSLIIFSGKDFFEAFKLPVTIPLRTHIDDKPYLNPLSTALEENPSFIIVLIDRTKAKIIEVNLGQEEVKSKLIQSDVPQRILAKGAGTGKESNILRHIEDHLHRHLLKVAKELEKFEKGFPDGLIIIAAQKELVGKFKSLLPRSIQPKVIGNFGADTDDNESGLIKRAQRIVDDYLEKRAWHEI